MACADRDKIAAARALEQIAGKVGAVDDAAFTPWHLIQTLMLAAAQFEQAGPLTEAERVIRDCVGVSRDQATQASRAHADVTARLAQLLFKSGSIAEVEELMAEALHAIAGAPEPSFALEEALTAWRKKANEKAGGV